MKIVKATMENLEAAAAFYNKVTEYLDANINYPQWTRGEYPSKASTAQAIEDGEQYICIEDEKIIGAFILNDNPQGNYDVGDWHVEVKRGDYLVIHTLATDPEIYGKGIGRYMVEYCIAAAKERGYKAVRLDAVPTNTPARKMYESMGFLFAGEKDLERGFEHIPTFTLYELNF